MDAIPASIIEQNASISSDTRAIAAQDTSNVARLLSRENITVIHANVPTACFDLKNRVMKLPLWKDFGKVVYDMLIAHEVGHAIFDDYPLIDQYFKENNIASVPDALNVIE